MLLCLVHVYTLCTDLHGAWLKCQEQGSIKLCFLFQTMNNVNALGSLSTPAYNLFSLVVLYSVSSMYLRRSKSLQKVQSCVYEYDASTRSNKAIINLGFSSIDPRACTWRPSLPRHWTEQRLQWIDLPLDQSPPAYFTRNSIVYHQPSK